jgi:hypothetical protein
MSKSTQFRYNGARFLGNQVFNIRLPERSDPTTGKYTECFDQY